MLNSIVLISESHAHHKGGRRTTVVNRFRRTVINYHCIVRNTRLVVFHRQKALIGVHMPGEDEIHIVDAKGLLETLDVGVADAHNSMLVGGAAEGLRA